MGSGIQIYYGDGRGNQPPHLDMHCSQRLMAEMYLLFIF
ncbi:hypothetical protein C823_000313 [Eubacterium plexicaudatum ASF492]|nr:hypothetical protein C823_000313 [Eubacterium plexicaudatum ASF492]